MTFTRESWIGFAMTAMFPFCSAQSSDICAKPCKKRDEMVLAKDETCRYVRAIQGIVLGHFAWKAHIPVLGRSVCSRVSCFPEAQPERNLLWRLLPSL